MSAGEPAHKLQSFMTPASPEEHENAGGFERPGLKASTLSAHDFSSLKAAASSVFATSKHGGLEFASSSISLVTRSRLHLATYTAIGCRGHGSMSSRKPS